jgi:hypothetical protein
LCNKEFFAAKTRKVLSIFGLPWDPSSPYCAWKILKNRVLPPSPPWMLTDQEKRQSLFLNSTITWRPAGQRTAVIINKCFPVWKAYQVKNCHLPSALPK